MIGELVRIVRLIGEIVFTKFVSKQSINVTFKLTKADKTLN